MYSMTSYTMKNSITASLLISMLTISILSMGLVFNSFQLGTKTISTVTAIEKISPTLLDQIMLTGGEQIDVLVETFEQSYTSVISDISKLGGSVRSEFKYINGIAATLPANSIMSLADNLNIKKIYLDAIRYPSGSARQNNKFVDGTGLSYHPVDKNVFDLRKQYNLETFERNPIIEVDLSVPTGGLRTISLTPEQIMQVDPTTYWNPMAMDALGVWRTGFMGQGSLAVIIDTGVWANHFTLSPMPGYPPTVIGGVDLSSDVSTAYEGWNRTDNYFHGTHVAGIFAGHGAILVHSSDPLYRSISTYATPPQEASSFGYPGYHIIPLTGMAPLAQIFAVKVFPHTGAGAPESTIISGIEYAIDLKTSGTYDVDIISMSLGGPTVFDGRDMEDMIVDYASSVGITVVSAAGNEGPAPMTIGSPGTAETGITVAAAAHPVNTRVFWDYYYGQQGIGWSLFVSNTPQIYAFSSRGPTSDGRGKPDVAATGIFVLAAYHEADNETTPWDESQQLAFASGTSMATPAVSGGAALLNSYAEYYFGADMASPEDYKQAIKGGAVWLPGYDAYDQGAGYLDAANALAALIADTSLGDVASPLPPTGTLMEITNIGIVGSGVYTDSISLMPGLNRDYIFEVTEETDSITLDITNVRTTVRDPFGINTFEVYIQSAKRTTYAYWIETANVWGNAKFVITDDTTTWSGRVSGVYTDPYTRLTVIEPGYVKITIENDWTSSGLVSGDIKITVTESTPPSPNLTYTGTITHGGWTYATGWIYPPPGTKKVVIELWWQNDWTTYPTSDIDMFVRWGNGTMYFWNYNGATLNAPERVTLKAPVYRFYVLLNGYAVYTGVPEPWTVKIYFYP